MLVEGVLLYQCVELLYKVFPFVLVQVGLLTVQRKEDL